MKRHFWLSAILLFVTALCFSSCENEELEAQIKVDAFSVTRWSSDSSIVYGLALHAYGNKDLSSVKVTAPDETEYSLSSYMDLDYDFYYEPDEDLFSSSTPVTGDYSFNAVFKSAETLTGDDDLGTTVLEPPKIKSFEYDSDTLRFELKWHPVDDADYFVVYLYDSGNIVYSRAVTASTSLMSITVSEDSEYFLNSYVPSAGTTYTVAVQAYEYQYDEDDDSFHIAAKSIANSKAVWGE